LTWIKANGRRIAEPLHMNVLDIMTRKVATVTPETPVLEVAALLAERRVSAVPVTDGEGRTVGIISEGDLMRRPESGTERRTPWWLGAFLWPDRLAERFIKTHGLRAEDVMTTNVVTIAPGASLAEAAQLMERHGVKRLPVTREDRIVGIVARADLVRALAAVAPARAGVEDDSTVRERLEQALERERWVPFNDLFVTVIEHRAHLWGTVHSQTQAQALQILARGVPGVASVESHLTVNPVEINSPLLIP